MKTNLANWRLIIEVQKEFTKTYPFLKIDFSNGNLRGKNTGADVSPDGVDDASEQDQTRRRLAQNLLWEELGFRDNMKINEVEQLLQYQFGVPAHVFRKSGNLWLETKMTQHWTLRQQNEQGYEIDIGFR
jgi:hypothetical protein